MGGSTSTYRETVPGLTPVRSRGTVTCVHTSPGVGPQVAAVVAARAGVWKSGDSVLWLFGKSRASRDAIVALVSAGG